MLRRCCQSPAIALTWQQASAERIGDAEDSTREVQMASRTPIGVIGLGLMGEALVRRLVATSFAVIGFDADAAKTHRIAALGGKPAASIAELAQATSVIVLAVFDTEQVEQVVEGELIRAVGGDSGKTVLCVSTCDPDRIAELAARVGECGLRFVEAPVSGSSAQVASAEGVALLGGEQAVISEAEPVLAALFPTRFRIGPVGDAGRAKLALNLILGLNRLALAEGLIFAERLGLDPNAFLDVARRSPAYSVAMDTKGEKMVRGDFSPQGFAHQHLKDIDLMLAQAERRGQPLPTLRVHADLLTACVAHGQGDLDNSVIIAELRRRGDEGPGAALLPLGR
jgi:3-hydroxyisobutyrate dehydrogenase-like beta-hydroxyacid dehydrogenase